MSTYSRIEAAYEIERAKKLAELLATARNVMAPEPEALFGTAVNEASFALAVAWEHLESIGRHDLSDAIEGVVAMLDDIADDFVEGEPWEDMEVGDAGQELHSIVTQYYRDREAGSYSDQELLDRLRETLRHSYPGTSVDDAFAVYRKVNSRRRMLQEAARQRRMSPNRRPRRRR